MERITKECPECNAKIRFPSKSHIKFKCPHCNTEFEVDNGIFLSKAELIVQPETVNNNDKKRKRRLFMFFTSLLIVSVLSSFLGAFIQRQKRNPMEKVTEALISDIKMSNFEKIKKYSTKEVANLLDLVIKPFLVFGDSNKVENFNKKIKNIKIGEYSGRYIYFQNDKNEIDTFEIRYIKNAEIYIIDIDEDKIYNE